LKKALVALSIFLLTACSDPSPLKSNIEVKINELFGTKFGVIDQVYIHSGEKTLTVMNPEELLRYLEGAEKVAGEENPSQMSIILKTSEGMKEYSKEQTSEKLSFDPIQNVICNEDSCYKTSEEFTDLIKSFK
jgi:hypothetical protein